MASLKFSRILLAIDETPCSQRAIDYTKQIVTNIQPSLALVTVVPPTSPTAYGVDPLLGQQPIIVPEVSEIQQQASQDYLNRVADEFLDAKETFTFNRVGDIRDEILSVAKEWTADLIIVGNNGRTGFDHFLSGSVSEALIRKATVPVLVIPLNCD
ncbi:MULTISPECIES: universal stress protein [Sphingobacterium]|uniref:Universal stress protein n=1 Tax=Sphingobacterium tenebrionis TaxID=3111775 RepID=A0ABU8I2V2_9SPHI|nr:MULTISPECIES: universal stress protein [unclassified Sphingobacterium]QBR11715.1 universal stress protein [Sphingobacterium sp. CZ-2]